jgi:protein TIF31
LKEGFELISEAYNLLTNVYGALHPEICMCLRLLARLNYILGDYNEALQTQHKAVMMCERLYGVDHSQTITEYTHLSLYCFANGQLSNSLKLLYRARYLLLINFGEDHPEMSLIDSNLGLILQAACEYEHSLKFLEKALESNKKYFGAKSMKTALSYHLLARLQSCRGDFRTALMNERETYQIYKSLLGEEHDRTKESAQVLKHLTEQAVLLQKKMNEMYKGGEKVTFPPIQIQQPSMQTVLAMLNIINGIIFIPSHEEEFEKIRDELSKYQQQQQQQPSIENSNSSKSTTAAAAPSTVKPTEINAQDDDLQ